jgi:hypothetical protein
LQPTKTKTIQPNNPILDRQIEEITAGLSSLYYANSLRSISNEENIKTIIRYIIAARIEANLSNSYRKNIIEALCRFSKYHNDKPFKDISIDNITAFLESFKKTEIQDSLHKWIGTYNTYNTYLLRFFKWLYSPNIDPDKRVKPAILENIPKLKRKEQSIYKPSDMWTQTE